MLSNLKHRYSFVKKRKHNIKDSVEVLFERPFTAVYRKEAIEI